MPPKIGIVMTEDTSYGAKLQQAYYDTVSAAGGLPLALPPLPTQWVKPLLAELDGLLLAGGDDMHPGYYGESLLPGNTASEPQRDAFEMVLIREAWRCGLPILAICRGMQSLNVVLGGTLWQDASCLPGNLMRHQQTEPAEQATHLLGITDAGLVKLLGCDELQVNSHHHQMVREIAPPLQVAALAADGVVEALTVREGQRAGYCLALQWHPERLADRASWRIFQSFTLAAQEFALQKRK